MEGPAVVTVAELVHVGRAVTGASSLCFSACRPNSHSSSVSGARYPQSPASSADSEVISEVLLPFNYTAILVGTLALPSGTLECPNGYCLRFSDDNSTICCDVVGLEVRAIGKKVCVLAWNFLPMEHGGGFLEIIKWKLLDTGKSLDRCSGIGSFPLDTCSRSRQKGDSKSRYGVHGVVESISPVSIVPCSSRGSAKSEDSSCPVNLRGFLVSIMACECELCSAKPMLKSVDNGHSFAKPVFIYFCGSMAARWHPVITKLVGSVVALSGMKKKLVYVSKSDSLLVFVTTEKSVLHLPPFLEKGHGSKTVFKKRSKCRSYLGIVKGVFMGGKLVELDEDVWLLLTDRTHHRPHSVRAGSLIHVRNVHIVNTKFPCGKLLILGACFRTSITVEDFSPFATCCLIESHRQSSLRQFIDSLSFPARFWALLVMSCFQKLSEKEIFGSYQTDEVMKIYVESHIPSSMFQPRPGLFPEFCMRESCGPICEPHDCSLKLVMPVSSFIQHYNAMLNECLVRLKKDGSVFGTNNCFSHPSSVEKRYGLSTIKILRSEDIGVILLGRLKISSSSGRLQLHDGIAYIDVLVPDLPSNLSASKIYEVADYCLIIEGSPEIMLHLPSLCKPFSCRSVASHTPSIVESTLPVCLSLCFSSAGCRNVLLDPSLGWRNHLNELDGGSFHIFRVTHKFPVLQNVGTVMPKSSSVFIEAIIFPWDLVCSAVNGDMAPVQHHEGITSPEKHPRKRCKTGDTSQRELRSSVPSIAHEISCQVTIRTSSNHSLVTSGVLCNAKNNRSSNKQSVKRVLLEFISEWEKYYGLQIGRCYLMKHSTEDSFCFGQSAIFNNDKIIFRPKTHIWSLDFIFDEVHTHGRSTDDSPLTNGQDRSSPTQPMEPQSNFSILQPCSDVSLRLSKDARGLFSVYLKDLEDLNRPVPMEKEVFARGTMTTHGWTSMTSPSSSVFPEGNLASFSGDVVAINTDETSVTGISTEYCIHLLVNQQNVKVFGSLSKHSYLTAFGPGVNASFYRILGLREKQQFLLLPASFIKVNSLKATDQPVTKDPTGVVSSCLPSDVSLKGALICDLLAGDKDNQAVNLSCKVILVHLLILQRSLNSENQSGQIIDIPLAGFVIDDGSSTCLCWASGKRAYTLLRLHEEIPQKAIYSETWNRRDSGRRNLSYHLEGILRKHNKLVVKSKGLQVDTLFQDVTISVGSNQPLTDSDDKFIKHLLLNGISGPNIWTVKARPMDGEAIRRVEREQCVGMKTTKLPLPNVWGTEVSRLDPLARANTLLHGLLNR
ncbi:PREDICTED: CST complex subunit CTC1 isoform X2 [Tarenaya hassleriana]|uniref:CST complex subunit CTC1 isoform X2 n=1 Tax=Tarenaya hassleriana TaxID=28532 RepID=UPI00053C6F1B|nr:PREDICTED: CST complex subunit CTC1 isoform X2 [Tarenaya hassleriana]